MSKNKLVVASIFSILLINIILGTGSLHIRERWSSEPYHEMSIETLDVEVNIQDQVAKTHVEQVFKNNMDESGEAMFIFPLPKNAMVTSMAYWVGGERYEAQIREKEEAVEDYFEDINTASSWAPPWSLQE